tara:strand:- start:1436 stop:2722 length:1287 start_codon:yes stop_codon:yes gene_type:complete
MSKLSTNEMVNSIGNKFASRGKELMNGVATMLNKSPEGQLAEIIIFVLIGLVIVIFVFWAYSLTSLQDRDCEKLNDIYSTNNSHINPISIYNPYSNIPIAQYTPSNSMFDPSGGNARLFSYYVKTAYNCCSPGNFSNSFVSLCALRNNISLGARCLDFEIYSLDLEPVVSTSTQSSSLITSFFIKETFNSLSLKDALYYIKYFALESSNGGTPNYEDPLYLHFRIMTSQIQTINLIAKYILDILGDKILGTTYGQNNYNKSLSNKAIIQFCGKCIIMVNDNPINSSVIMGSELWPLINIFTGGDNYKLLKYSTIKNMSDDDFKNLTNYNKFYMTMVIPDNGNSSTNYDSRICLRAGCQFIAMNFQSFDSYLETYFSVFDEVGFSYILKPCSLRWIPVHYLVDDSDIPRSAGCTTVHTSGDLTLTGNQD